MGKKSWFWAVKKAISPSCSKIKKGKRSNKSKSNPKNLWHANQMNLDTCSSHTQAASVNPFDDYYPTEFKLPENEQIKHVDSITYATTNAQEVKNSRFIGKTREEISAIKIQTAYRGYKARRAFRSIRAMMRLKLWIQGQAVKHQTSSTLIRMQTMSRVRSQVQARRARVAQVNETVQRQLLRKRQKLLEKEAFDLSPRSKEQVDAMLKSKKEAAERRKKALAYAYSRQQAWRNSQKNANPVYVDPNHFNWQWSWSHRWDVIRPWETGTTTNKESSGQISKPGPSLLKQGSLVGLAKKRDLITRSPCSTSTRSFGAPRNCSINVRSA